MTTGCARTTDERKTDVDGLPVVAVLESRCAGNASLDDPTKKSLGNTVG
jgi:hypothetical protein